MLSGPGHDPVTIRLSRKFVVELLQHASRALGEVQPAAHNLMANGGWFT
jgi:hypothetical protein